MTMIENVARAIATAREQNGGPPFEAYDQKYARPALFDEAKAAVQALRDVPRSLSSGVMQASLDLTPINRCEQQALQVWQNTIDAILGDA